jgi:hypothetical protein
MGEHSLPGQTPTRGPGPPGVCNYYQQHVKLTIWQLFVTVTSIITNLSSVLYICGRNRNSFMESLYRFLVSPMSAA